MKAVKLYIYNGIENQLDEISGLKEAKEYIKDYIEDGDIHPDIESIIILEEVGGVTIDETGEQTKLNGDIVPVCKVDVFLNNDNKKLEEQLSQKQNDIDELVESLEESTKRNFQLLQDNVKLEGEIINLKSRLSKYENINSQLKK